MFKEQRIAQATLKAIKPQRLPDLFDVFPACLRSLLPAHAAFRCMSSRDRERSTLLQAAEKLAESPESLPGSGKTGSGCTSNETRWRGGDTQWLSSRAVSGLVALHQSLQCTEGARTYRHVHPQSTKSQSRSPAGVFESFECGCNKPRGESSGLALMPLFVGFFNSTFSCSQCGAGGFHFTGFVATLKL